MTKVRRKYLGRSGNREVVTEGVSSFIKRGDKGRTMQNMWEHC